MKRDHHQYHQICEFSGTNPALNCNDNMSMLDYFKKFIIDDIISDCNKNRRCRQKCVVDEALILYKGRLDFR